MENDYSLPFIDFLNHGEDKFAIVITKNQYVIICSKQDDYVTHEELIRFLIKKITPNLVINKQNRTIDDVYYEENIIIVGRLDYAYVNIPSTSLLSREQFESLKEVMLDIKKFNETSNKKYKLDVYGHGLIKVGLRNYEDKIDELLEYLSHYITDDYEKKDEIIIGKRLVLNNML